MTSSDQIRFWENLPDEALSLAASAGTLLVYDEVLAKHPGFAALRDAAAHHYPVAGGESLKDLKEFPSRIEAILDQVSGNARRDITVVAAGGGSVGDFAGFVASVLLRGVTFVNIPTTWLAAIDSAHGGKTALNVGGYKNQVGTFHRADQVWIVKELLVGVPAAETRAAFGELLKMAMLTGGDLFAGVQRIGVDPDDLWAQLPAAVAAKNDVVAIDPTEDTGHRQILNLGHTLGHALEAQFGVAHGVAVGHGLRFAVEWSRSRGYLSDEDAAAVVSLLGRFEEFGADAQPTGPQWDDARLAELLRHDKKATGSDAITFVFLDGIGSPRLEEVEIGAVVAEAGRQGFV